VSALPRVGRMLATHRRRAAASTMLPVCHKKLGTSKQCHTTQSLCGQSESVPLTSTCAASAESSRSGVTKSTAASSTTRGPRTPPLSRIRSGWKGTWLSAQNIQTQISKRSTRLVPYQCIQPPRRIRHSAPESWLQRSRNQLWSIRQQPGQDGDKEQRRRIGGDVVDDGGRDGENVADDGRKHFSERFERGRLAGEAETA